MCVCYPLFGLYLSSCIYIYHSTVYMFFACYGTNKLSLCDFCTFVQINNNNNKNQKSNTKISCEPKLIKINNYNIY